MGEPGPARAAARRAAALASAALAGAAGLGLEGVLLSASALAVGHGRAAAYGLGVFVAGWALGARWGGRRRGRAGPVLALAGATVLAVSALIPPALFALGRTAPGGGLATLAGVALVALGALPQGVFLPLLARVQDAAVGRRSGVAGLFAANLAGSVAGAHLIGYRAVGALGRPGAALVAGSVALLAGALGALAASGSDAPGPALDASAGEPSPLRARAGWVLSLGTLWLVGLEWIGVRLGVLWLGGQQLVLTSALAATMVALSLGAALLPAIVHRDERGPLEVLALAIALSTWPVWAAPVLERAAPLGAFWTALALLGPALAPLGALVPVLHRALPGEGGARLGGLLAYEAVGALLAGPLVHAVLVPALGLGGAVATLAACGAGGALLLARERPRAALATILLAGVVGVLAGRAPEPALASPKLSEPTLAVRAFTEDDALLRRGRRRRDARRAHAAHRPLPRGGHRARLPLHARARPPAGAAAPRAAAGRGAGAGDRHDGRRGLAAPRGGAHRRARDLARRRGRRRGSSK